MLHKYLLTSLKDINNEHQPYIGCVNATPDILQKHYYGSIKGHTSIDLEFLEQLFNDAILPAQEECGIIKPLTSRRKYCGTCFLIGCQPVSNRLQSS
jgi:hypothetical protein